MSLSKDTILLVHGTFAGPKEESRQWWQGGADHEFVAKLHAALAKRGIEARCWSHCAAPDFHWSGENDWVARMAAGVSLTRYISGLARAGWRCHLVGHSHGGNVIVEALNTLHGTPEEKAIASVVTLGTPFLNVQGVVDPHKRQRRLMAATMFAIGALFLSVTLGMVASIEASIELQALAVAAILLVFGILASIAAIIVKDRSRRMNANSATPIPALALNSRYDEAWQLLHHVRDTSNPLAVRDGLSSYLGRQMRAHVERKQAVQDAMRPFEAREILESVWLKRLYRLLYAVSVGASLMPLWTHGWSLPGFLVGLAFSVMTFVGFCTLIMLMTIGRWGYVNAFIRPLSNGLHTALSLGIVPSEIVTYLVRMRSWNLLQRWVMGLDGYRFDLPAVRTIPERSGAADFQAETLHDEAERRALASRTHWLASNVDGMTKVFSQVVLSAADVARLLHEIEQNVTLVHAAYYIDDASIDQIADWIAASAAISSVQAAAVMQKSP